MNIMNRFGGFAQVIMLCGYLHYISLFDRSKKDTGVTGTSKHHSFRKEVQDSKGANTCPFILPSISVRIPCSIRNTIQY